jgi:hypothetical protein
MGSTTSVLRNAGLLLAACSAWLIFSVGLIAPLTPSEGMPHPIEILAFVGLPIALLSLVVAYARTRAAKIAALLQVAAILMITAWVLATQARL